MHRPLSLLLLLTLLLAGCGLWRPSESAMQSAISDHVGRAEAYPTQFMKTENFVFRDLQKVNVAGMPRYSVRAEFDFIYVADGATIVAALKAAERERLEKEKRRNASVIQAFVGRVRGAFAGVRHELRFDDVKIGDRDHYSGLFTLVRNEDDSWRVDAADYQ